MRRAGWIAGLLVVASAGARADVLVVDFGGGGDYTDLGDAVAAAADGDVLLVRPGIYTVFELVDGRSLTIAGDGPFVQVQGTLVLSNLAPGQRVVLSGIGFGYGSQIDLVDNDGVVWIEDCTVLADQQTGSNVYGAVHAVRSRLVVQRCLLSGSIQYGFHAAPPTAGLYAVESTVAVAGSTLVGGEGLDTIFPDLPGGTGLVAIDSTVFVEGSGISGGFGGTQAGGDAVTTHAAAVVHLRDTVFQGGGGTPSGAAASGDGTGTVFVHPGAAHAVESDGPVRAGDDLTVTVTGPPGDPVWLFYGIEPAVALTGFGPSMLLLDLAPPPASTFLGPLPPAGTLSTTFPIAPLGALEGLQVFSQEVYVDLAVGGARLGPGTAPLLLSPAF